MDDVVARPAAEGLNETKTTYSTCYMCTTNCPITVVSQGDEILDISHPECVRATAMLEQRESDKRLVHAMIRDRAEDDWRMVNWDDAVADAAGRLDAIRKNDGADKVAFVVGYTKESRPYMRRIANAFGSPHYITESSCCFGATFVASELTFGEDYNHFFQAGRMRQEEARCRVVWSNNPKDSLIPYSRHYLLAESAKVPVIVVDPRRTSIAEAAEIHLQPRPGTDGALALGWAHVILNEGLEDRAFLDRYAHGFDEYREYVKDFTPERVEEITRVPAEKIVAAARLYATSKPAQITISQEALVQHTNGLQTHRAVMLLSALTGNLDVKGGNRPWPERLKQKGVAAGSGVENAPGKRMGHERFPLFVDHYNEGQAMLLAESIEQGKIKGVVAMGTNLMMWPNSNRLEKALRTLDVFLVADFFDTPTVDAASVFLPTATHLERQDLVTTLGGRVQYRPAAVSPRGAAHGDTEMLFDLAAALGHGDQFWGGDIHASYAERMTPLTMGFDDLPKNGKSMNEDLGERREREYEDVGFKTPTGKVEFSSTELAGIGQDALPVYREPKWSPVSAPEVAKDYPLVLTSGGRSNNFTHSQGRNLETLRKREPHPRIQMNPKDAAARGISDGDDVVISSPVASIGMKAWVTDIILDGVVHAPHGWREANINSLYPDDNLDPVSGYPSFKSSLCQVEKA